MPFDKLIGAGLITHDQVRKLVRKLNMLQSTILHDERVQTLVIRGHITLKDAINLTGEQYRNILPLTSLDDPKEIKEGIRKVLGAQSKKEQQSDKKPSFFSRHPDDTSQTADTPKPKKRYFGKSD